MRTSLYLLAGLLSLSVGCVSAVQRDRDTALDEGTRLVYFRDARTGLCFAGQDLWTNAATLTNVPCTDQVQKLIAYHNDPPPNPVAAPPSAPAP